MSRPLKSMHKQKKRAHQEERRRHRQGRLAEVRAWLAPFSPPPALSLEDALLHVASELFSAEEPEGHRAVDHLVELFPDTPQAVLAVVTQLLVHDDVEEAAALFSTLANCPLTQEADSVHASIYEFLSNLGYVDPHLVRHRAQVCDTLEAGLWSETEGWIKRTLARWPGDPPTLNNLSQLRFYQNRLPEALKTAQAVLAEDPDNVNALSNLVRFCLCSGRPDEAHEYGRRLRQLEVPDGLLRKVAEALALLGDDKGLLALPATLDSFVAHLRAVALARTERWDEAIALWEGLASPPEVASHNLANARLPEAQRHHAWPYSLSHWLSDGGLRALMKETSSEERFATLCRRKPSWNALVPILLDRGDPQATELALRIARAGHHPALVDFGQGRRGSDHLRFQALMGARDAGLVDSKVEMWQRGERRTVSLRSFCIEAEAPPEELPSDAQAWLDRADRLGAAGHWAEAERCLREALVLAPDEPVLLNNLGCAVSAQGREKEADDLLQALLTRHPDYFFGLTTRAHKSLEAGDVETATEILDTLGNRERLHVTEFSALCELGARVGRARGYDGSDWTGLWKHFESQADVARHRSRV